MIGSVISTTILRESSYGTKTEVAAPSSPDTENYDARQLTALLPDTMDPLKTDTTDQTQQQDVNGQGQDQSTPADDIRQAAAKASQYFKQAGTQLEFVVGEQTGRVVIKVVNSETHEVVRQIPPEQMQRFADTTSQMRGLLFEASG